MPTYTPTRTEAAETLQLHERARQLQIVMPSLPYNLAVLKASEQLERGERVEDPQRTLLHSLAQRYAVDHRVGYREALMAVGPEYERVVAGHSPSTGTVDVARESDDLDREARRRMAEDSSLSYRDALITAGKPKKRPSERIAFKTEPAAQEDPDVRAYADSNAITYEAALLALAKAGLASDGEQTETDTPATAAVPSPARIAAHAKARGIKASAALVELMAEGR